MDAEIYLLEYVRRRSNYEVVLAWLDEKLFQDKASSVVFRAIQKGLKYQDAKAIDYNQIVALSKEIAKDPDVWDEVQKVCKQMAKIRHRREVIARMSRVFLIKQHTLTILKDTADDIGAGRDVNLGKLKIALSKLESIGDSGGEAVDLFDNPEAHFEDILSVGEPVPTPLPELTEILDGGPAAGELCTIIALPDGGKTLFLLDLTVTAIEAGFPTFVAVLERGKVCISRLYCRIANHSAKWLSSHRRVFDTIMRQRAEDNANIRVMDYSRKEVSVSDLRRDVSRFVEDFGRIGCIIIDYGDLLRSSRRYDAKRHELDLVWVELSRLAQEFGCPVWTATQSNRLGTKQHTLGMENVAEAWAKMGTTDIVLTISRNEREKQREQARIYVAKTKKTGGSAVIPVILDRLKCRVRPLGDNDERPKRSKKEVASPDRKKAIRGALRRTSKAKKKRRVVGA